MLIYFKDLETQEEYSLSKNLTYKNIQNFFSKHKDRSNVVTCDFESALRHGGLWMCYLKNSDIIKQ